MRDPEIRPIPPTEPSEDFQLIRRFLETGDPRCFRSLVERHQPSVRRLLWVMLDGAREEVEDVEQEVLLALYRGLGNFRFQSSFRTYLLSMARYRALDALRRRGDAGGGRNGPCASWLPPWRPPGSRSRSLRALSAFFPASAA